MTDDKKLKWIKIIAAVVVVVVGFFFIGCAGMEAPKGYNVEPLQINNLIVTGQNVDLVALLKYLKTLETGTIMVQWLPIHVSADVRKTSDATTQLDVTGNKLK